MHIKHLEIQGFKSYKDQAGVEDFSSGHNTVIGRNGSGKSNFFRAIQFVLCEKGFSNLTHKERTELLHEGSGTNVMTAYVQMVFDNTDGRFPFDAEEVTLRRTIGLKKDEYFLNNKHFSKSDVINLLESAGFSRSNPYYIVQQGKVNALCLMKDEQRLELLKAVAGTTVYEERRVDSENIMRETNKKREKIGETVKYIEERLAELDEEKTELQAFRQLDRQKRALEYTLYDKELQKSQRQLELLDQSRAEEVEKSNEASQQVVVLRESASSKKQEAKSVETQLKQVNNEKESLESERAELVQNKAKQELKIKDLEERESIFDEKVRSSEIELREVEEQIAVVEEDLQANKLPLLEACKNDLAAVVNEMNKAERRIEELEAKKGRKNQFETQEDRDRHLRKQISQIEKGKEIKIRSRKETLKGHQEDEKTLHKLKEELNEITGELNDKKEELSKLNDKIHMLKKEESKKSSDRKERQRELQKRKDNDTRARNAVKDAERKMKRSVPHRITAGIDAVNQIVSDMGNRFRGKVYGPLYELIEAESDVFNVAIEVAAGNQLHHVIVDHDDTGAVLIEELRRRKAGRVTFKALNVVDRKFQGKGDQLHDIEGYNENEENQQAFPIVNKLRFDLPEIRNVVRMVLGKTMLCENSDVARRTSNDFKVSCVTLDGDEVNRSGTITGGYREKTNVLSAIAEVKKANKKLRSVEKESSSVDESCSSFDAAVNALKSEINTLKDKRNHIERSHKTLDEDLVDKEKQIKQTQKRIDQHKPILEKIEKGISELDDRLDPLRKELSSPMEESLSAEEKSELISCRRKIPECRRNRKTYEDKLRSAETAVKDKRSELNNNLCRTRDELVRTLRECEQEKITSQSASRQLESAREEFSVITDRLNGSKSMYEELDETSGKLVRKQRQIKETLEQLKADELRHTENLQQCEERIEKILTKRGVEKENITGFAQRIRELGSLPASELEKVKQSSIKKLMSSLGKTNEDLKKYSHVNKKALDQFVNFSDQREALLKRKAELDDGHNEIKKLIKHLDRQKDEAIMRTFRGVAKNFREVFKELVPHGRGELVMVTASSNDEQTTSGSSNDTDIHEQVDKFVGVSPRVSFTGRGDVFRMRQLSGGQRALVALTLIFAIQRCDPAPFYLFDEIDQALDANHRRMVAALIKRQTQSQDAPTQFITTTFRPELVAVADKTYGIQFQAKVSSMVLLEKEDAMEFIRNIAEEEGGDRPKGADSIIPQKHKHAQNKKMAETEEEKASVGAQDDESQDEDSPDLKKRKTAGGSRILA